MAFALSAILECPKNMNRKDFYSASSDNKSYEIQTILSNRISQVNLGNQIDPKDAALKAEINID